MRIADAETVRGGGRLGHVHPWPRLPPGPTTAPVVQILRWLRAPVAFMEECAERYGDAFTMRLAAVPPLVFFSHPQAVDEILTGDPDALRAGEANESVRPLLGHHSLLLLDGDRHLRTRRLMLPAFHGSRVQAYGDVMRAVTARAVDRWAVGKPFSLQGEMQEIALDVITRTLVGEACEAAPGIRALVLELLEVTARPFWRVPWLHSETGRLKPWGRFTRLRQELDDLIFSEIARRRAAAGGERDDLLSLLIDAHDEMGRGLTDAEIKDEVLTLLVAGHETTATCLAWVFHHLLERRDVLEVVLDEVRNAVGGGPVTPGEVAKLVYLDATIRETLRLNPVFAVVGRRLRRPMHVDGWALPGGVVVAPCIYLTHRRPDVWPDPERFDPARFLGKPVPAHAYFPFGGGGRRCLGHAFAMYEMKVVVAEVLTRVTLRRVPGPGTRAVRRSITLAPSDGVRVVVAGRAPQSRAPQS